MQTRIPSSYLDPDAVAVIERLQRAGYVAYLVGGCVRDGLLGTEPKDFDIATTALPEELKDLFGRRCRLIGRRFKLAHVRGGSKVFEVATFRGRPEDQTTEDDSGFVVRANTFGSPEEDALSRDFTINGLFYDPLSGELHDHVGGVDDVELRRLRTIGDPEQRFREDPVRLLRAVKFSARLGLDLDSTIVELAREMAPLIHDCPVARVTEELYRLLESGHARPTIDLLVELDILDVVLPEVAATVEASEGGMELWRAWLSQLDRQVRAHGTLPRESTFVMLTWPLVRPVLTGSDNGDWGRSAMELVQDASVRMSIPQRHRHHLRGTANLMSRLLAPPTSSRRRGQLTRSPSLPTALTLLRVEFLEGITEPSQGYEHWASICRDLGITPAPFEPRIEETALGSRPDSEEQSGGRGSGRRGRSRRRGSRRGPGKERDAS